LLGSARLHDTFLLLCAEDYWRWHLSVAVFLFLLVSLLPNWGLFFYFVSELSWRGVLGLFVGTVTAANFLGVFLLVLAAFLVGLNVALLAWRSAQARSVGVTGVGGLLGVTIGGCAGCGLGLLPLLGFSGVALLPFHGLELMLVAVALLSLGLFWSAESQGCRL
jgi:hypothetical protein